MECMAEHAVHEAAGQSERISHGMSVGKRNCWIFGSVLNWLISPAERRSTTAGTGKRRRING